LAFCPISEAVIRGQFLGAQVRRATSDNKWIRCDLVESEQSTWTTTVVTLRRIRDEIRLSNGCHCAAPSNDCCAQAVRVMLLCGGDFLQSFLVPGLWSDEDVSLRRSTCSARR